jgi:hypothetical protein
MGPRTKLAQIVNIGNIIQSGRDLLVSEGEWIMPLAALLVLLGVPSLRSFILTPLFLLFKHPSADEIASVQSGIDDGTIMSAQSGLLDKIKRRIGFFPKTIVFIEKQGRCNWSMGSISGEPAMHIIGHWYATNVTNSEISLVKSELNPNPKRSHVLVKEPDGNMFGSFPLVPSVTTEVIGDFWIKPPIRSGKKS